MQDGRDALLDPGEFAVYDLHRPVSLAFEGPFTCLSLRFSGDMLELPRPLIAEITATKVSEDDGVAGVAAAFFVALGDRMGNFSGRAGASLARNAVDLVNTVLRDQLDATAPTVPIRRGVLVREVLEYIDANLGDPELSPSAIASAHFISTRYVHAIFRDLGVTVSEWIVRRRLEQCRRELTDPRRMDDSIASIAARAGLSSASYFSQAFRKHFGESATEVRNHALALRSRDHHRL
jgi:AraC-like DNA-binding protein